MLLFDEAEEVVEVLVAAIEQDQLVDDRAMHILRGELVRVAVDDLGHTREVVADCQRVLLDDEAVVADNVVQQFAIALQVRQ